MVVVIGIVAVALIWAIGTALATHYENELIAVFTRLLCVVVAISCVAIITEKRYEEQEKKIEQALDDGWKVYVDGEEVDPDNIVISRYAIELKPKEKKILCTSQR